MDCLLFNFNHITAVFQSLRSDNVVNTVSSDDDDFLNTCIETCFNKHVYICVPTPFLSCSNVQEFFEPVVRKKTMIQNVRAH